MLQLGSLLGAPTVGHLLDHGADAERVAVAVEHRVVARQPEPLRRGIAWRPRNHLERSHRLARLEHAPGDRLERRREVRDDLGERPSRVILGRALVDHRERVVDAHVAQVAVPEAEADRCAVVERVEQRRRALRLAIERGVLERAGGLGREDRLIGHVAEVDDHVEQLALRVTDRDRRDLRDTVGPTAGRAVADESRCRLLAREGAVPGQLLALHRCPVRVEDVEPRQRHLGRRCEQLLGRREAGQARRRVVRVQPVAVRRVDDDAVAEMRQDRSEQLAGSREGRRRAVDGLAHALPLTTSSQNVSRVLLAGEAVYELGWAETSSTRIASPSGSDS